MILSIKNQVVWEKNLKIVKRLVKCICSWCPKKSIVFRFFWYNFCIKKEQNFFKHIQIQCFKTHFEKISKCSFTWKRNYFPKSSYRLVPSKHCLYYRLILPTYYLICMIKDIKQQNVLIRKWIWQEIPVFIR